jgi:putative aldouronate transport system permease protein
MSSTPNLSLAGHSDQQGVNTHRTRKTGSQYRRRGRWSHLLIHVVLSILSLLFVLPLLLVLAGSFSTEQDIARFGYSLIPRHISLDAYQYLFNNADLIASAYGVSIVVTLVGSAASLLVVALLGYAISRRDFHFRRTLSFFSLFPLLFNGGLVPTYIMMTQLLHVQDTLLAYILPYLVLPWNVLLLRTYFAGLPSELIEAAKLDGAGEWRIFFQIVVPMSTPALATVGLLIMLVYWNDWFQGLLYISNTHLMSLQYLLYQISQNVLMLNATANQSSVTTAAIPAQSVLMAMAVLAIGPIVFVFLFTQRYFVRGITLGGLKGD